MQCKLKPITLCGREDLAQAKHWQYHGDDVLRVECVSVSAPESIHLITSSHNLTVTKMTKAHKECGFILIRLEFTVTMRTGEPRSVRKLFRTRPTCAWL
jgi:hypothetical protein